MNTQVERILIEVDESYLAGWVTSAGPGGTARFVETLEHAAVDEEARGFTLQQYVDALNEAADARQLPFDFEAHTSTYNGARSCGEEAVGWEDDIHNLMLSVEERLRGAS